MICRKIIKKKIQKHTKGYQNNYTSFQHYNQIIEDVSTDLNLDVFEIITFKWLFEKVNMKYRHNIFIHTGWLVADRKIETVDKSHFQLLLTV